MGSAGSAGFEPVLASARWLAGGDVLAFNKSVLASAFGSELSLQLWRPTEGANPFWENLRLMTDHRLGIRDSRISELQTLVGFV